MIDPKLLPIYFYCDFRTTSKTKSINICRSLCAQILESHLDELPAELEQRYDQRSGSSALYEQEVGEIFQMLAFKAGKLTIVIDALDECVDRVELLTTLKTVQKVANVNILITSREEPDIKVELEGFPTLPIKPESVNADISLFIREEMTRRPQLRKLKPELKTDIQMTLVDKAQGM